MLKLFFKLFFSPPLRRCCYISGPFESDLSHLCAMSLHGEILITRRGSSDLDACCVVRKEFKDGTRIGTHRFPIQIGVTLLN